jgi:hypothetical protein
MGAVKGWTRDGRQIELTRWQETAVRQLLGPRPLPFITWGRRFGWPAVLATAGRYDRERIPLPLIPAGQGPAPPTGPPTASAGTASAAAESP